MHKIVFAALLSSTALLPATAMAQAEAQNAANDCSQLVNALQRQDIQNAPVTLDRARTLQSQRNTEECRVALVEVEEFAETQGVELERDEEGRIVVQQGAPTVVVDTPEPEVTVDQAEPQVSVRQPQPEVIVRQPEPTITVDLPQPEIIVRMPDPEVDVDVPAPDVAVSQPEPNVRVSQPEQPQVRREGGGDAARVRVSEADGSDARVQVQEARPQVRYERTGEPNVNFQREEGQPEVRYEQMGADENRDAMQQQSNVRQQEREQTQVRQTADESASAGNEIRISRLEGMQVINAQGEQIGDVEHTVAGGNGDPVLIISHGGFLGLGEKEIAVPVDQVAIANNRIVIPGLTNDQISEMQAWDGNAQARQLDENETARIRPFEG